tara:strand:+ start:1211 stop:1834 length:624 start_codon:yes stop_codon:yes gene_type:complete
MKTSNDSGWVDASENVFLQQLERNISELYSMPEHWDFFIQQASKIKGIERIVDIGCGAGALCQVAKIHLDNIEYIGYDYSGSAINVAKSAWGDEKFIQKDYTEIRSEEILGGDLLVANALCDVCPEGDKCMENILGIGAKNILVLRVETTDSESFYKQYRAYGEVDTYSFHHNEKKLKETIEKNKYKICSDMNNLKNIHLERFENEI